MRIDNTDLNTMSPVRLKSQWDLREALLKQGLYRDILVSEERVKEVSDGFGGFISKDFIALTLQFGSRWFANLVFQLFQVPTMVRFHHMKKKFRVTSTKQLCTLIRKQGKLVGVISILSQVRLFAASKFTANSCIPLHYTAACCRCTLRPSP